MNKWIAIFCLIGLMTSCGWAIDKIDTSGKVPYEKKVEDSLQRMADAVAGAGQVVVAVDVDLAPGEKRVSYTQQAAVNVKPSNEGGKKSQYIMPGVPAMKNINASDGGPGLPFDYKEESSLGEVRKINVTLMVNQQVPNDRVNAVRTMVDGFLRGRSGSKSITVLKEKFSATPKTGFNTAFGQFADKGEAKDYMTGILREATREVLRVIPSNTGQPLEIKDTTAEGKGQSGLAGKGTMIAAIVVGVIVLALIGLFVLLILMIKNMNGGTGKSAGSGLAAASAGGMAASTGGASAGMMGGMSDSFLPASPVSAEGDGAEVDPLLREKRFFAFINSSNVHKLKHLLQLKIALNEANPKTVAMVLACLSPDISAKILVEYPPKIQAEIVSTLVNLEQYEEDDVMALEKEIADKIGTLLGGGYTIRNLIESLSTENKKSLTKTIAQRYPAVLDDIRDFIVLFEDILALEEKSIKRIFGELDANTIATAICKSQPDKQAMIMQSVSPGNAEMIAQWIDLKGNNISFMEIEEAQSRIIKLAKKLESDGLIKIEKIDFLKADNE